MTTIFDTLGASPIPGGKAVGIDIRDDPDFDRMQTEIDKLSSPSASASTDWDVVRRAGIVLLSERGKDLLVACYLAGALMRRSGLTGLADGLKILNDMTNAYWDQMYPPLARMRARRNALQWLIDRANQYLAEKVDRDVEQDPVLIDALQTQIDSLDLFVSAKDPDAPSLRAVASQIRVLPVHAIALPASVAAEAGLSSDSAATPTQAAPASVATSKPSSAMASAQATLPLPGGPLPAASVVSLPDYERAFEQIGERVAALSTWLRTFDLTHPQSYRLNRFVAWGTIDMPPPANGNQTAIPGPIGEVVMSLDRLQSADAASDAIRFAEAQLPAFPFWLDLNRVTARALAQLGEAAAEARAEVEHATARFLMRVPDLPNLAFSNSKPFADAATIEWLGSITRQDAGSGAESVDTLDVALATARVRAAEGDVEGAATLLQRESATLSPEHRLRASVHLCELMLEHRPNANLRPFVAMIVTDIDRHALDQWAPALALKALSVAYRAALTSTTIEQAAPLIERIARIDPAVAVKLASGT